MRKKYHALLLIICSVVVSNATFSQGKEDTTGHRFHDDLLNHLVGKWNVSSVAHGFSSTATITAEWILNHQHLHVHFTGNDIIPWIGSPMEFDYFIGYNHNQKRYIVHGISVFGNDDDEGFWYGNRDGNELKLIQKPIIVSNSDTFNIQRLTWQQETNTWLIQSRQSVKSREGDVFLSMKLTPANS